MGKKVKVFIADDDEKFVASLVKYINTLPNMEVISTAEDGKQALLKLSVCHPDIIILDTFMPCLDGLSVLEKIVERNRKIPVCIMLSVIENDRATRKAMQLGALGYLIKPIEPEEMVSRMRSLVKEIIGRKNNLEERVAKIVRQIGIPIRLKGCRYLRDAIIMIINDERMMNEITGQLYPTLAKMHDTTPTRIERAIRHATEVCWNQTDPALLEEIFGRTIDFKRGRPTNSEFMVMLADKVRIESDKLLKI